MALQFILGDVGSGKTWQMSRLLLQEAEAHPEQQIFVVTPEQFTNETQRAIVAMSERKGVMNIDVLSFMRLSYRLFEESGKQMGLVLEDTGKNMVLRRVMRQIRDELTYFGKHADKLGFTEEIKSFLTELGQYRVSAASLMELAGEANTRVLGAKLKDAAKILDAFNAFKQNRYITAEEILDLACGELPQSRLVQGAIFAFDGFTGFTPVQLAFVRALMPYAAGIYMTITIDPAIFLRRDAGNESLYRLSLETMERMRKIADEQQIPVLKSLEIQDEASERMHPAIRHLRKHLFRYPAVPYEEKSGRKAEKAVRIRCLPNPHEEAEWLKAEILRLAQEEGYRYREIGVIAGDLAAYGDVIRHELTEAGIPIFLDLRKSILENPFVEMIRGALAVLENNYRQEDVMRFLRAGFTEFGEDDLDRFENVLLACGFRGRSAYEKTWESYRDASRMDAEELEREAAKYALLNRIRERVCQLFAPLQEAFRDPHANARTMILALYRFVSELHCAEQLYQKKERFEELGEAMLAREYDQIYRLVMEVFEKMADLMPDEKLDIENFRRILEAGFSEQSVGQIPPGLDQVIVGDLTRTRFFGIRVLFVLGVNEGLIPAGAGHGGILTDREKEQIAILGTELSPTAKERMMREQFYLLMSFARPSDCLYLLYSTVSMGGDALKPSPVLGKIQSLFPEIAEEYPKPLGVLADAEPDGVVTSVEACFRQDLRRDGGIRFLLSAGRVEQPDDERLQYASALARQYERTTAGDGQILRRSVDYRQMMQGSSAGILSGRLRREIAEKLYGKLVGSISRLELFSNCAFAHFLTYGLGLRERDKFEILAPDFGSIFHEILKAYSDKVTAAGLQFADLPDDVRIRICDLCIAEVTETYGRGILQANNRVQGMIDRLRRMTYRTTWHLNRQISMGEMEPVLFESGFYNSGMTGRVDRIDLATTGFLPDGKQIQAGGQYTAVDYVRIVDYKTGSRTFSLDRVYYGLDLQLFTYLREVREHLKKQPGHGDHLILPAGAFYDHIDDPVLEQGNGEDALMKKLRFDGPFLGTPYGLSLMDTAVVEKKKTEGGIEATLVSGAESLVVPAKITKSGAYASGVFAPSPEGLLGIETYTGNLAEDRRSQILAGEIGIRPARIGNTSACDYCSYRGICGFDRRLGYRYRELDKHADEEVLLQMLAENEDREKKGGKNLGYQELDG